MMLWPSDAPEVKFWKDGCVLPVHFSNAPLHNSKSAFLFLLLFFYDEEGNNNSNHSVDIWIVCHKKKGEAMLC